MLVSEFRGNLTCVVDVPPLTSAVEEHRDMKNVTKLTQTKKDIQFLFLISEYRIYAGRGVKFVSKEGKTHIFLNSKVKSLSHQRVKPVRLTWTQAWRRANKKIRSNESTNKRRARRTVKVQKAIVGLSLDDLKKKNAMKKAIPGTKAAALKEARARQINKQQDSKAAQKKVSQPKTTKNVTVPKNQPKVNKAQTASNRR